MERMKEESTIVWKGPLVVQRVLFHSAAEKESLV
jgi:hypothetical protein